MFKCYNTRLIKTANIELSLSAVFFLFSDNDCTGHYVDLLALVTTEERGSQSLYSSPSLSHLFNLWLPVDRCQQTLVLKFLFYSSTSAVLGSDLKLMKRLFVFMSVDRNETGWRRVEQIFYLPNEGSCLCY